MAGMEGVVSVLPSRRHKLETTRSWDFIGFPENVERSSSESDIIIGVLDSGIWPESSSFDDQGFGPVPSRWRGRCKDIRCNKKLIGATAHNARSEYGPDDDRSPRDTHGHGSHCASIAVGNGVPSTSLFGLAKGTARGGVPSARIAAFKVCWSGGVCNSEDIHWGFLGSVISGVDVISVSLGDADRKHYHEDMYAIGAFYAMQHGILTVKAAGNAGIRGPSSMANYAPWYFSVAVSSIDTKFYTKTKLGNRQVYQGFSMNTFDVLDTMYPLIYAGDAPNITGGFNSNVSRSCREEYSLNATLVKGKIVLCDGFGSEFEHMRSGAIGFLLRIYIDPDIYVPGIFSLPTTILSDQDGERVLSYIQSARNPRATILKSHEANDSSAPFIGHFSSRGPNPFTPDILKPDTAAPGVNILAAWSPRNSISTMQGDTRLCEKYNIVSGTSVATPHVAAIAGYVKSFHPDWSPAAIKSALMTTATPMSSRLNPQAEFAYGAGELNPIKAVNPGLVYNISALDYARFLCGQGYTNKQMMTVTGDSELSDCDLVGNISARNLNLPSFALQRSYDLGTINAVFHRNVTNVGKPNSKYTAKVDAHFTPNSGIGIEVNPKVLEFTALGEELGFTATITGITTYRTPSQVSASLVWVLDDGSVQVRSPVVVYGGNN